jgi:hypothetical protein
MNHDGPAGGRDDEKKRRSPACCALRDLLWFGRKRDLLWTKTYGRREADWEPFSSFFLKLVGGYESREKHS